MRMTRQSSASDSDPLFKLPWAIALEGLVLIATLLWSLWPSLSDMVQRWSHDPRYSHGFLVPAFALYLLWHRRTEYASASFGPSWWGIPLIIVGAAIRVVGAYYYYVT